MIEDRALERDFNPFAVFTEIWRGRWIVIAVSSVAAVISVVIALMMPNIYRAEALLAPAQPEGLDGIASQYSGLASMVGIDLPASMTNKTVLGIEILRSRKFLAEFVEEHDLLVPLIAAKGWDAENDVLVIDSDDFDTGSGQWVREVSPPRKQVPSDQEAFEKMLDIITVRQDTTTGFVRISVEHYSPAIARQWVDLLVADLNRTVMESDVHIAEQAIEYLEEQASAVSLAEMREVFFRLIGEHTKTVLLARVSDEYVFRTVDPATVPEKKSKPKRLIIVVLGTFFGFVFALFYVLTFGARRKELS